MDKFMRQHQVGQGSERPQNFVDENVDTPIVLHDGVSNRQWIIRVGLLSESNHRRPLQPSPEVLPVQTVEAVEEGEGLSHELLPTIAAFSSPT